MDRKYIIVDYIGNTSGMDESNLYLLVPDIDNGGGISQEELNTAIATVEVGANSYADGLFATLVETAPEQLDTLNEIAAALQNNPNIVAEILTSLGTRLRFDIANQGLSVQQKTNALTNLGIVVADLLNRANHTGSQAMSTITGLVNALAGKSDKLYRFVGACDGGFVVMPTMNVNYILYSHEIPANTFTNATDYIRITALLERISTGSHNFTLYLGTNASSLTGAQLIATFGGATTLMFGIERTYALKIGNVIQGFNNLTASFTDRTNPAFTRPMLETWFNKANRYYLHICDASTGDGAQAQVSQFTINQI